MADEQPADPFRTSSPGAGWAPDVTGPDGILVTIRVEPSVDRLKRLRHMWAAPDLADITSRRAAEFDYQTLPGLVQKHLLGDRWAVDIEADSGERIRIRAANRDEAIRYASQVREGIAVQGVPFLRTLDR